MLVSYDSTLSDDVNVDSGSVQIYASIHLT